MIFLDRLKNLGLQIFGVIAGAIFMSIWVVIQWVVDVYIVRNFGLTGIDKVVLVSLQYLFAISTFIPVASYVALEVLGVVFEARMQIRDMRLLLRRKLAQTE